jgi:hypothetical protein
MTEEFDLRDVLSGRKYPTARIPVVLDDEVVWEIAELQRQLTQALVDTTLNADEIQKRLDVKMAERDAGVYWVHLRATSPRARAEAQSKALAEVPFKPDIYGRDDVANARHRSEVLSELAFATHITKIVSPNGAEQVWTPENQRDLARAFLGEAPEHAIKIVDAAIMALRGEEQEHFAKVSDLDFLSRT